MSLPKFSATVVWFSWFISIFHPHITPHLLFWCIKMLHDSLIVEHWRLIWLVVALSGNSGPNNREFQVPNLPTSSACDAIMTTRTADVLQQPTQAAGMDFNGTWQVYHEENLEDFLKVVGEDVFLKGFLCLCVHQ